MGDFTHRGFPEGFLIRYGVNQLIFDQFPLFQAFDYSLTLLGVCAINDGGNGMAPLVSQSIVEGLISPRAIHQGECYKAAVLFARTEGIIPAPETSHAIAATMQEANKAKEEGKEKVIIFNLSGHGLMDLTGYDKFFSNQLQDYSLPEEELQKSLSSIENLPKPKLEKSGRW